MCIRDRYMGTVLIKRTLMVPRRNAIICILLAFFVFTLAQENPEPKKEVVCHYSCKTCSGPGEAECLDCTDSRRLRNGKCECQRGFVDTNQAQCERCHFSCDTCEGTPDKCTSCPNSRTLDSNRCKCQTRFFEVNSRECQGCHSSCLECKGSGEGECTSCVPEKIFSNGKCKCPTGTFVNPSSQSCLPCNGACAECWGGDADECLSCNKEKHRDLVDNKCQCSGGFYELNDASFSCGKCHPTCKTCFAGEQNECVQCPPDRDGPYQGKCICGPRTFEDNSDGKCKKCHHTCDSCQGEGPLKCIKCGTDREFHQSGECVCKQGYFELLTPYYEDSCIKCHPHCKTCNGPNKNDCIECPEDRVFVNKKCVCRLGFTEVSSMCMKIEETLYKWAPGEVLAVLMAGGTILFVIVIYIIMCLRNKDSDEINQPADSLSNRESYGSHQLVFRKRSIDE
eukprot:TRINITY_DN13655_c0_g2_i1.p1 TRINITY_DN13655_c0_g2~~TRINITY_DN13655_c0_g2_i1.p1  ORF type:complete len:452 (-),score=40.63 TRINITY_DN13655_c0_g2_i1:95-1450(-)